MLDQEELAEETEEMKEYKRAAEEILGQMELNELIEDKEGLVIEAEKARKNVQNLRQSARARAGDQEEPNIRSEMLSFLRRSPAELRQTGTLLEVHGDMWDQYNKFTSMLLSYSDPSLNADKRRRQFPDLTRVIRECGEQFIPLLRLVATYPGTLGLRDKLETWLQEIQGDSSFKYKAGPSK